MANFSSKSGRTYWYRIFGFRDPAKHQLPKWKDIVKISGPQGLKLIKGFKDEALSGNWKGFRSSRLNIQYRVIYKVQKDQVLVEIERVTPHDYRR